MPHPGAEAGECVCGPHDAVFGEALQMSMRNPAGRGRIEWSIGLPRQRNRQLARTESEAQKAARTLSTNHTGVKVTVYRDGKPQHTYRDGQWEWTAVKQWKDWVKDDDWWMASVGNKAQPWLRSNPSPRDGPMLLLALGGLIALGIYQQRKSAPANEVVPAAAPPERGVLSWSP